MNIPSIFWKVCLVYFVIFGTGFAVEPTQVSSNNLASECKKCTQKQLLRIADRLIAFHKHANEPISYNEYRSLKDLILTPEMKCQINKIDAYTSLLSGYARLSEDINLDLQGIDRCQHNVPNSHLLLKPLFVKSSLVLKRTRFSGDKAEVIMLRKVSGDDRGKVWRPYQEELVFSFECIEGRWTLQDILFKDLKHPSESFTLKEHIDIVTKRQAIIFKEWEPRVEAALSKATHTKEAKR